MKGPISRNAAETNEALRIVNVYIGIGVVTTLVLLTLEFVVADVPFILATVLSIVTAVLAGVFRD